MGDARGEILERSPLTVDPDGRLAGENISRVVYRSTAGYAPGDPTGSFGTRVSGYVAVPSGTPPPGGWPIVAFGHGTTGTASNCGPSGYPDLLGETSTVATLLDDGYVVAASDYQGLGESDVPHPYLNSRTIAYNMIDMVRAAREMVPQAGTRWAAIGSSQGGQAAWASAEHATDYGTGLEFVGAAALAPAADVAPIADGADAQPYVAPRFTQIQMAFIPLIVDGLRAVYPDFPVSDYMRGALAAGASDLTSCGPGSSFRKFSAITKVQPGDATIASADALRRLHDMLLVDSLPQRRSAGPLFVGYGDADQIITPAWTAAAVRRACAMGDTLSLSVAQGKGHTNTGLTPSAIAWIGNRFAGDPAPSTCSR
ncbi:lipase family protein [Williamsia phyllosphaerae]|uniref:Lipase n=1 Tax=Williamsia phyllosphaerae TaxID=885042 RepID=A0ABQ1V2C2_9NOCA|nr:lipase family protein [Williamsia phyllosphaerae]GGF34919.1 putative lipase [Williamsia phyllosphaerae]